MTITKELFLAILSMDAYNRGYGTGVTEPGAVGDGLGVSTDKKASFAFPIDSPPHPCYIAPVSQPRIRSGARDF